jgi:uncharacterized protein (DUF1697 family)
MADGMALVVFLRGINVGGHRRFRPSVLAAGLRDYDVVSVGAAGTFVVRKPGTSAASFCAEVLRKLPFQAEVMVCRDRDLMRLETENPFATMSQRPGVVRFVSILPRSARGPALPIRLPQSREWYVRLISSRGRFIFGEYRRHMRTIRYLGNIDKLYGVPVTTRNWNTILAVVRLLKQPR